ncbi:hypothetical protein LSH36_1301g00001 [Paralvinella palmiformis]|uniref:G-protein coupled receptors family 1 profile domain-containing protein n=1 Tax=Paralvinella palmiformis TaxID=53620 RepID=A0AAD9IUH9_9ANNE|nr:hypothetical protein LSH36_1301g00001 [Paralvinella palmiformis]
MEECGLNTSSCVPYPTTAPSHGSGMNGTSGADPHAEFYRWSQFVTGVILYPIVIVIGLTGNTLTLIVLRHRKMLTSTNVFLAALAVSDIVKLLNDTLYFLVSILLRRHPVAGNRMLGYMYPFSHYIFNESVCVSAWLTVSVAVERYISVCHATRARVVCTVYRARLISAAVFLVMSLVAVPSAFRYTSVIVADPERNNSTKYQIVLSTLGRNQRFMTVYTWIQNLLRSIIPLFVLIALNSLIIQALRIERVRGKRISSRNRITLTLIVVVVVFIICIFPDAIMSTFFGFGYVDESDLVKGIREFTDALLSINSAVNFAIYCVCSRGFRDIFNETFCRRCGHELLTVVEGRSRTRSADESTRDGSPPLLSQLAQKQEAELIGNGQQMSVYIGPQTSL